MTSPGAGSDPVSRGINQVYDKTNLSLVFLMFQCGPERRQKTFVARRNIARD